MLLVRDVQAGRAHVAEIGRRLRAREHVHMVGMAGFGMAGLALLLREKGLRVTGCDLVSNRMSEWLTARGFSVFEGHDAAHIENASWLIRSTAVPDSCPEIRAAMKAGLAVEHRGFVLPALLAGRFSVAVSGTHGKTTASAMIAQMLARVGQSPSFCIGGEVSALGGVAGIGHGDALVVEADESDGTLVLYEPDIAVITNVEFDHMEHFETPAALEECFRVFAESSRRTTVYCADDPRAATVAAAAPRRLSYGMHESAHVRVQVRESLLTEMKITLYAPDGTGCDVDLPVPGTHNARNAAAAFAVGTLIGLAPDKMARALSMFVPVKRRLEVVARANDFCIVTDYGHHPTEIRAVMDVLTSWPRRRLIVVFQPHRYTRTRALGPDFPQAFRGADEVVLLPVYAASERPLPGGMIEDLAEHFRRQCVGPVRLLASLEEAWNDLRANIRAGDIWLILGAGDVEQVAWRAQREWGAAPCDVGKKVDP